MARGGVGGSVIGDNAYDAETVPGTRSQHRGPSGASAALPRRHQRRFARRVDRRRNLSERCFCRLKQLRRLATRYEKLAERFVSLVSLVAAFGRLAQMSTVFSSDRTPAWPEVRHWLAM